MNVGVDLHKHQFTCYFREVDLFKIFNCNNCGYESFCSELLKHKSNGFENYVAVETTGNTRHFVNMIERYCKEVSIVNTLKFKVVCESVNKTDKHDAKTLAEFLSNDFLPKAVMSSKKSEQLKRLLASRDKLVKTNVKLKNQVHGILLSCGIETKAGQLNSKKGRKEVVDLIEDDVDRSLVVTIINAIENILMQIDKITELLIDLTKGDRVVEILKSIPGTGYICAITARAFIDDIARFARYEHFSAFTGLVPYVQCSDKKEYYGSITKRGPQVLRTITIQMVLGMIRCKDEKNNRYMRSYQSLKKQKGSGKALVATGRKFTKMIWTPLTKNEEFNSDKASAIFELIEAAAKQDKQNSAA